MKRIRQGNTIHFRYSVYRSSGNLEEEEDLTGIEVTTSLQNRLYGTLVDIPFSTEGNVITGQIPGIPHLRTGVYNFCLSYQKDGTDFAVDTDAFQIVDSSSKTGGENTCPHVEAETVELKGVVEFGIVGSGSIDQVQADWKESNTQSKAFIKNKPDLKMVATSGSYNDLSDKPDIPTQLDVPTKTSQLTNDSGFISDTAYVHTDNNYTASEKDKLEGIQEGAEANVNADWNATTGDAEILNKPVLSKVATSGSYNDLKDIPDVPGIPSVPTKTSELENDSGFISDPNYVHTDNNYSNEEKEKVAGLQNYDDTTLRAALQSEINRATLAEGNLDTAVKKVASDLSNFITGSPDADDIINRWQEVTAFLNGITEDKTLSGMLLDLKKQIDENVTSKLSDYYTSVRVDELFIKKLVGSRLITEEEATKLADLQNYDDTSLVTALGTKVDKVEGKQLSSNDFTSELKTKLEGLTNFPDAPSDGKTYGRKDNTWKEVSTSGPAYTLPVATPTTLGGVKTGSNITNTGGTISIVKENVTDALGYIPVEPVEGKGLFSGSYNDLKDKPSIPVLPEGIVTDANYVHTDNNYTTEDKTKLSGLSNYDDTSLTTRVTQVENNSPVSLDVTEWMSQLDPDSTSSVKITGTQEHLDLFEKGVKNGIMAYSTSDEGKVAVVYQVNLDKTTLANAVSYVLFLYYINPDSIKRYRISLQRTDGLPGGSTIGGYISQSTILDLSKKANLVPVTEETSPGNILLYGNEYYKLGNRSVLTIVLAYASELDLDFYYEYMFEFIASVDNMPLNITNADGSTIKWITEPDIKVGKTYQVSIVNNLAVIGGA